MSALRVALAALVSSVLWAGGAAAQEEDLIPPKRDFVSPERFTAELKLGPYSADFDDNDAYDAFFSDDSGPMLAFELQAVAYRWDELLYLTAGGGIGWASFKGNTINEEGERTSEETELEMVPLSLLGALRIDALARKLSVPLIVTGKIGHQWARWSTEAGGRDDADGWSLGLLYGVQFALDLDFFEPSKARILDEEWGINHSYVAFDLYGFEPSGDSLPLGTFTWSLGLGFVF